MNDLNGDDRRRIYRSEILWVVAGKDYYGSNQFGIQMSIERVVHELQDHRGLFVVLNDRYYPLHSKIEFEKKIEKVLSSDDLYFSNHHGFSQDPKRMRMVSPAPFIYEHEEGPIVA